MNLVTIDDIASLFKVNRRTVAERWIHRPDFPAPVFAPTRTCRRWAAEDVIAWGKPDARKTGPYSSAPTVGLATFAQTAGAAHGNVGHGT